MHDPRGERRRSGRSATGTMLRRTNRLADEPGIIGPPPKGHNGGPLLPPDDPNESWRNYCWRRAHKSAWKTPPREIALRRLERAEALAMTYHDYTLEILERGRYL